jgi:hypothetical protein
MAKYYVVIIVSVPKPVSIVRAWWVSLCNLIPICHVLGSMDGEDS